MNAQRGEVAIGGHTLVFSVNAICDLEDELGKGVAQIAEELESAVDMRTLRAVVWAGLQEHHAGLSQKDAGRIITEVGVQAAVEAIEAAFSAAFPQSEQGARGKSRPRKAR